MCHNSCSNLAKLVILGWRNHTYPGIPGWSVASTADAARYNSFQGLVSLFYHNFLSLMLQHNKLEHCNDTQNYDIQHNDNQLNDIQQNGRALLC
jgi:hypothetical protein